MFLKVDIIFYMIRMGPEKYSEIKSETEGKISFGR